jgi:hypothetical protein
MEIGIFQLLPRGRAASDREVLEQALWEVDFAERRGFDSVWIAEHHFSGFGLVGAPSVYAAAIAQRTRRIRIGYAVAVVPLHQPLRLAEEIAWVDQLSEGRVMVGFGPGFSAEEFAGFGVPLEERHARLEEGFDGIRRAFAEGTVRPHPYTRPHPPFYWAVSSDASMEKAEKESLRTLVSSKNLRYASDESWVLHRIPGGADETLEELNALRAHGVRRVIAWFHDEETPHADVRRSMEIFAGEVMPALTKPRAA